MTLGPKFELSIVLPPKCWNRFVIQSFLAGSKALVEILRSTVSKRDLKVMQPFEFISRRKVAKTVFKNTSCYIYNPEKITWSQKCQTSFLLYAIRCEKIRWIHICSPLWLKPSKIIIFWMCSFWFVFFCNCPYFHFLVVRVFFGETPL